MNSFQELGLPEPLLRSVEKLGFSKPTPIQAAAIPAALSKRDIIACAETGSGKTTAFCLPLLARFLALKDPTQGPAGLILVPTRELALQIEIFWNKIAQFVPRAKCVSLIGGTSIQHQRRALDKRPLLIVATPGRLADHLKQGNVSLSRVNCLVLDEADRMLDMGFMPQLRQILRFLPSSRQTLFFSATWSNEVNHLSKQFLRDPQKVLVGPVSKAVPTVDQVSVAVKTPAKNDVLVSELRRTQGSVLVFARTKSRTDRVAKYLNGFGMGVSRLHGGRTQGQRKAALQDFRSGKARIMIATDIAARGIDVTGITQVINYDLPQVPEDYVHRIGRTARAGASGKAMSFVTPEDRHVWGAILRLLKASGSRMPEQRGS